MANAASNFIRTDVGGPVYGESSAFKPEPSTTARARIHVAKSVPSSVLNNNQAVNRRVGHNVAMLKAACRKWCSTHGTICFTRGQTSNLVYNLASIHK